MPTTANRFAPSPRCAGVAALLLLTVLGACSEAPDSSSPAAPVGAATEPAAAPPPVADAGTQVPASVAADASDAAVQARAAHIRGRIQARMQWWKDGKIASQLGLQSAQRDAIEARIANHAATRERARGQVRAAQQEYRSALLAGELERAREAARWHAALVSEEQLAQRLLVVEVLEVLDPPQRTQLVAEHPELLVGMAAARGRGGERAERRAREGRRD